MSHFFFVFPDRSPGYITVLKYFVFEVGQKKKTPLRFLVLHNRETRWRRFSRARTPAWSRLSPACCTSGRGRGGSRQETGGGTTRTRWPWRKCAPARMRSTRTERKTGTRTEKPALQPLDDAPKSLRVASWRTQEVERSKQRAEIEDAHKAQRDEIEASLAEKRRKHEARAKRKRRKEAARKKAEAERKAQEEKADKHKAAAKKRQLDRQKLLERQLIEKGGDTMRLSVGRGLRTRSAQDRLIRETADTVVKNLEGDHALLARVGANLLFRELHAIDEPEYLMCPITLSLFSDPVCAPSGHTYEREAIESHLSRSQRDPMTREPLTKDQLWPNLSLKKAVDAHRRLFPDAGQG